MKQKQLLKTLLAAVCLLVGTSAWAADALTKNLEVTGYKAVNLFDFQNKNYDGTTLSSFNDLSELGVTAQNTVGAAYGNNNWYDDTANSHGLRLQSGGGRWIQFTVDVKKDDYIIINGGTASEAYEISMTNGESVSVAQASDYLCFKATQDATTLKLTAHRYNYLLQILIMTKDESAATADYTLRYVAGGSTIKEETKNGTVGTAPILSASEKANFTKDDVTYIYDNDNASSTTIVSGGTSVVTLNYHAAATYSYTVKSSIGTTLLSSTGLEASSVSYKYPQYILSGTDLYEAAKQGSNPWYGKTFTLTEDNQEETITYTKAVENVVYYSEAEKIEGASSKTGSNAGIRCSNGAGAAFESNTTITTLPAGKYVIKGQVWGNAAVTFNILAGTEKVWTLTTNGNLTAGASDEFIVNTSTDIIIEAAGDNGKMLDWVYIQKTGERFDVGEDIITNGSFATNTDGWTLVNYKRNPTAGQNSTPVVESWDNAGRAAGSVTQSVGYLPTGNYVISASVLSGAESYLKVLNASDDSEIASIECTGSWYDKTVAKSFTLNEVKDVKVQFSTPAQSEDTWWSYITNVSLIYYGSNTPVESNMAVSASNKAKYGTFYAPYDVKIPTLIKAYTAQNNAAGTALTLTEINGTIPAYTPVILENNRSNDNAFNGTFYGITTEGTPASSALTGTLEVYTLQEGNYIMQYQNNETAFYLVSGDAVGKTIAANRCYIAAGQNAKAVNVIYLDSETTAINNVTAVKASMPVKRIVNGQLVIEKDGKQYNAMGQEK